jgi:hypothetical protein
MNKEYNSICYLCLSILSATHYQHCSKSVQRESKIKSGKMLSNVLTDAILALLHAVAAPHHRRCGRRGGRCHRRPVLAPAPPQQPPPSTAPHRRVLERPPSPSLDRPAYRSMEPSDPDASPWGRRGRPCAIHNWGCPNRVAPAQGPSSSSSQGVEERREEENDECHITVVTGPVGAPTIHQTTLISIGPHG